MLANNSDNIQTGRLEPDIHLPSTAKVELMDFIAQQLPSWRDHPDRSAEKAETVLTDQLCSHLNSACNGSNIWSHVQFRTETRDETHSVRTIDLTAKPSAATLFIEGRRHTQFDSLFPIECKRLPTPVDKDRDQREYVTNEPSTTGGIQRFKFGHHGAAHNFAAMIGYVQDKSFTHWLAKLNSWIDDLSKTPGSKWNNSDTLQKESEDSVARLCTLNSHHLRDNGLDGIALRHVWISMN